MKSTKWIFASALGLFVLTGNFARAQGHGHGNGKGNEKHENEGDRDAGGHDKHYYKDHDRSVMRGWYDEHEGHLPPGLAKRDQLPPGLQRQLVVRGTLPPGLQNPLHPAPHPSTPPLP